MRTAIIFSGTAQSYRYSIQSLMDNIVIPNDADVFILLPEFNHHRRTRADKIPLAVDYIEWNEKSNQIERIETKINEGDLQDIRAAPEWKQVYRAENNNGLLILERQ